MHSAPTSPLLGRYAAIRAELHAISAWRDHPTALRFAALVGAHVPGEPAQVAREIGRAALELQQHAGWFGAMHGALRYTVAAALVATGADPKPFAYEAERVQGLLRELHAPRGKDFVALAIAVLRVLGQGQAIPDDAVVRVKHIYDRLKARHWWLTGADDLPACALLASCADGPAMLGNAVEALYTGLRERGYAAGNHLQAGATLLALPGWEPAAAIARFDRMAHEIRTGDAGVWYEYYPAVAALALADGEAPSLAARFVVSFHALRAIDSSLPAEECSNLAAGIVLGETTRGRQATLPLAVSLVLIAATEAPGAV